MDDPDALRSDLHAAAASIHAGDPTQAREAIDAAVHARRVRARVLGGVGAAALLIGGAAVVLAVDSGDAPGTLVDTELTVPDSTIGVEPPTTQRPEVDASDATVPEATVPDVASGGLRTPVDPDESVVWVVPWDDGFLVSTTEYIDNDQSTSIRFTTDGATWESVEMTMPPGASSPGDFGPVAVAGDRLVVQYSLDLVEGRTDTDRRVASTTDLHNWTTQDVRPVGFQAESPDFGWSFTGGQGFAANQSGWVSVLVRVYDDDVTSLLPSGLDLSQFSGYDVHTDDTGFTVDFEAAEGGEPASYDFTWSSFGITPEDVPFLTGEVPTTQAWAASWDGTVTQVDVPVPGGPIVATPAGFVQWDHETWFSQDGVEWSSSPLPDPTGIVQHAFAVDGGLVAIVNAADGSSDVYRLDERGGDARRVDVDGLADSYSSHFGTYAVGLWEPSPVTVVDAAGPANLAPVVFEADGYRLEFDEVGSRASVIDLSTGDVVLTTSHVSTPPLEAPFVRFDAESLTVVDPATGRVLMRTPIDEYNAVYAHRAAAAESVGADETVSDLHVLASPDGERFLVEDLSDDNDAERVLWDAVANGERVLVRLDDEWIQYVVPS